MRLFGCYYLVPNFDFFINWVPESPRTGLPKTSKQSLPAFTPSISGKTRGDGEKWLWYLDSASLNYPGTDTLVHVIELAEICVKDQGLSVLDINTPNSGNKRKPFFNESISAVHRSSQKYMWIDWIQKNRKQSNRKLSIFIHSFGWWKCKRKITR